MNLAEAFLLTTGFSYFAAAFLPVHFEKNMDPKKEKIAYLAMGTVFTALPFVDSYVANLVLGALYAGVAMYCYGGKQDWGSPENNALMTAWDLAISVACFSRLGVAVR